MADQERMGGGAAENLNTLKEGAEKHGEALRNKLESERKNYDKTGEVENAKHNVERAFEKSQDARGNKTHQPKQMPSAPKIIKKATKNQKKEEFKKTMTEIQKEMNPAERTFSKVIHNPVVEKTSDVVGATVARPAALLAGSLSAFILTALVYIIAKHYGYPLSGTESIAAFVVGWLIGLLVDWIRVMILGKRAGPA